MILMFSAARSTSSRWTPGQARDQVQQAIRDRLGLPPARLVFWPSEMTLRILELVTRDESSVLMLRWEAAGPGGQAVPGPGRRDHANPRRAARHPALAGRSLPACAACPGAGSGKPIVHRAAAATTWSFRNRAADALATARAVADGAPGAQAPRPARHPQRPSLA